LRRDGVPARFISAADGNLGAFFREQQRRGLADALGSSGNESDFVVKAHRKTIALHWTIRLSSQGHGKNPNDQCQALNARI